MTTAKNLSLVSTALMLALSCGKALAANPIVAGQGLTDPFATVYGGRVYLYATHDFSPANTNFLMKDWWVWSSSDLVDWKQEGTLSPQDTFIGKPFNDCWATSAARKNGKYYWYFSAGRNEIGVVSSDSPTGPWKDPLGKPLVPAGLTPTQQRDPEAFTDDDGATYLVYGTFDYFIVRLGDDMISLAETPHPVQFDRKFGPYGEGKTDDKPSLHKRNGLYYLSWSSFYAVSKNVYGPYTYKGSVIDPDKVAPEFLHQNLVHDRHGNFFEFNNQWYYACNDKSQPGRSDYFRDTILSYVHYRDNGDIAPVRIDALGVGQYDACQPRIEAEDYFNMVGADKRECPVGGFEVRGLEDGSSLLYPKVHNLPPNPQISFQVSCGSPKGARIEIREGNATGKLLGTCHVRFTGGWNQYEKFSTTLHTTGVAHDLCFDIRGRKGELLRLDWFKFSKSGNRE